ncbi:hypothetical protein FB451DRAFT_1179882 [Mycena latifolia]|nr:hypothetical protein FB451DRAFT_1179882 [Mycena latifolia]
MEEQEFSARARGVEPRLAAGATQLSLDVQQRYYGESWELQSPEPMETVPRVGVQPLLSTQHVCILSDLSLSSRIELASNLNKTPHKKNTTSNECSDQISTESDGLIGSYGIADRDPKRRDINFLSIRPLASFAIAISPPFLPRSTTLVARSDPPMLVFHLKRYWTATD